MSELTNIQIQRVEEMRLGKAVNARIAELLGICFKANYQERSFYQNRHHCRILLTADDILVGHTALGFRAIRQGNAVFDVVGLAEVAVHPDFRGLGLGTRMMDAVDEEGRAANASFALLFGVRRLYEACGYRAVANEVTYAPCENVHTADTVTKSSTHLRVKPLGDLEWDEVSPIDLAGFAF